MRVLHVSAGALWGGVELALVTLARERAFAPQMLPHFAVCFRGRLSQELRMAGSAVDYLGEVRASRPFSVLAARRALKTVLAQEQIHVAVCHLPWAHAIFAPVLRQAGVPVVFFQHGFATGRHWTERWARLTPPSLVLANSQATAATSPLLFPGVRTEVLRPPVPLEVEPAAQTGSVIVQVSRMEPWKGHRLHLEALALLKDLPGWTLRLVGGPQTPSEERYMLKLHGHAERLGIGQRVEFLGQRTDVEQQLAAAAIFSQPNTGPEPFGIALIEALAAGLPVVATRLGAAEEILDNSCGILTEPGNAPALAAALRRLLTDAALRAAFGAAGPARAKVLCAPEQQVPALEALLRTVTLEGQKR